MKQRALLRIAIQFAHTFRRPTDVQLLNERRVAAERVGKERAARNAGLRAVFHDEEPVGGGAVAVAIVVGKEGDVHVCGGDGGGIARVLALNDSRRVRARVGVYMMAFGEFGGRDDGGCDDVRYGWR